jgi:hypothetical protein
MVLTIRLGRGALMRVRKSPKARAGGLLWMGGCIFLAGPVDIQMF